MAGLKLDFIESSVLPQVVRLEGECYGEEEGLSMAELELYKKVKERDWIFKGNFLREDNTLISYMLYCVQKGTIHVVRFCVAPKFQRNRIGHAMLSHLRLKLDDNKVKKIRMVVSDGNYGAHQFLQSEGFICTEVNGVEKEWYVFEHQYVGNCV